MTAQSELQPIEQGFAASLSRSYFTALTILGDTAEAEALVIEAIESLDPENTTGNAIRDAVVERLVQAQIGRNKCLTRRLTIADASLAMLP